jgi:hypothetical protein
MELPSDWHRSSLAITERQRLVHAQGVHPPGAGVRTLSCERSSPPLAPFPKGVAPSDLLVRRRGLGSRTGQPVRRASSRAEVSPPRRWRSINTITLSREGWRAVIAVLRSKALPSMLEHATVIEEPRERHRPGKPTVRIQPDR